MRFLVSKILLYFFFISVIFPVNKVFAYNSYPTMVGYSWAWPGDSVTTEGGVKRGGWDMLGWQFENDTLWRNEYKPKIWTDIQDMLWRNGGLSPGNPKNKYLIQVINIPAYIVSEERLRAIVERFTEISIELDVPIMYRNLGNHWWDWEGCPSCQNNTFTKNDIEWWGWSSDYIWAIDSPKDFSDPNNLPFVWRDWGAPFKIKIPHPDFNSVKFRDRASQKISIFSQSIAIKQRYLDSIGKGYLIFGFIPETEVFYGWSFHPEVKAGGQYGVKNYINRKCPNDVLNCLPPKPINYTREDWIKKMSDEFYRPDDYHITQIQGVQDYFNFIGNIVVGAGIPQQKIFSHSGLHYNLRKGTEFYPTSFQDASLNNYSIPAYSLYGGDISSTTTLDDLKFLKSSRGIKRYGLGEFMDCNDPLGWDTRFTFLLNNNEIPKLYFLVFQNWEGVLQDIVGKADTNDFTDSNCRIGALDFVKKYLEDKKTYPTCGNSYIEQGESCEFVNSEYRNQGESSVVLNNSSCDSLENYYSGNLSCNSNCTFNTSNCSLLGDANSDRILTIQDANLTIKAFFQSSFSKVYDMDKNGKIELKDIRMLILKFTK